MKIQQRFRSEKHDVLTNEINKVASSSIDDKRIQSIGSTETYVYLYVRKYVTQETKCNNIIKKYKNVQLSLYYKRRHEGINPNRL